MRATGYWDGDGGRSIVKTLRIVVREIVLGGARTSARAGRAALPCCSSAYHAGSTPTILIDQFRFSVLIVNTNGWMDGVHS